MLLAEALRNIAERLMQAGIWENEAHNQARLLLADMLDLPFSQLGMGPQSVDIQPLEAALQRLEAGEPIQYVLGEACFMGLDFRCRPGVLIPRLDSEAVAEVGLELLAEKQQPLAADICCGSGAYGLAFAKLMPACQVVLTDIAAAAISLTKENAALLEVEDRIRVRRGDLFSALEEGERFDLICSNPPYIAKAELETLSPQVKREPMLALDGGEDGLDYYRRIAVDAAPWLKDDGVLLLEHGDEQRQDVSEILEQNGFVLLRCIDDYAGRPRGIAARLA